MRYFFILPLMFMALGQPAFAEDQGDAAFRSWLEQLRDDASQQGVSQATIDNALDGLTPIPEVIEMDQKQPEKTLTFLEYSTRTLSDTRIAQGKRLFEENNDLLKKVSKEYGVQPQYIVALWGIESNFGDFQGQYSIVQSLATLAYDGRRPEFFRKELINALTIIDAGDISSDDMKGSWAGAMGQCQFMPSSFLEFAVDYDHDGKRDIWNDNADVFASIANYLNYLGWNKNVGWGMAVDIPQGFDLMLADIKTSKSVAEWKKLGVGVPDGMDDEAEVSLILVGEGDDAMPFLITDNYKALLKWNHSRYFATAVGMLADQIVQ